MTEMGAAHDTPVTKIIRYGGLFFYTIAATVLGSLAVIWMVKPGPLAPSKEGMRVDRRQRRYRTKRPMLSHGIAHSRRRQIDARRAGGLTPHEEMELLDQG